MDSQGMQMGQLQENEAVRQFLQLLMEERPGRGRMADQLHSALQELHDVREQLAKMQGSPEKRFVSRVADAVEGRLHAVQACLAEAKGRVVEGAKKAVEGFKRAGVKALDQAACALGIKKGLESIQRGIRESIVEKSIGKVEGLGHELRSAGGHLKNAGRALMGKEQQEADGGSEGRFQAAVLSPLRMEKTILNQLNNMALAAIGGMEILEQAAGQTKGEAAPDKGKEKTSVLKDLQEKKVQAAACPSPVTEKGKTGHEAAL